MIVVDLTVTTPGNQMAHAARAHQRRHRLLQCIKKRLARSDISLQRMNSVAVGGIGDIASDSLIEPRRPGTRKAIFADMAWSPCALIAAKPTGRANINWPAYRFGPSVVRFRWRGERPAWPRGIERRWRRGSSRVHQVPPPPVDYVG